MSPSLYMGRIPSRAAGAISINYPPPRRRRPRESAAGISWQYGLSGIRAYWPRRSAPLFLEPGVAEKTWKSGIGVGVRALRGPPAYGSGGTAGRKRRRRRLLSYETVIEALCQACPRSGRGIFKRQVIGGVQPAEPKALP